MSCRKLSHPDTKTNAANSAPAEVNRRRTLIILHLGDVFGMQTLQKPRRFRQIEFGIAWLDTKEKSVRRGVHKSRHVENRMVRLRQFIQPQHSKNRKKRSPHNRQLKRN